MLLNLQSSRLYRTRRHGSDANDVHSEQDQLKLGSEQQPPQSNETDPLSGNSATNTTTTTQRLYSSLAVMPPACSLLESYVTGTGSPLRNLYCQCKHHHHAIQIKSRIDTKPSPRNGMEF
uniref:Uncharacterized protein n=1 Tax=Anopheles maculatus TaxID=74869 RepID=A0A182S645_9DIPT